VTGESKLNRLGREVWEVVGVLPNGFILKRPLIQVAAKPGAKAVGDALPRRRKGRGSGPGEATRAGASLTLG
jgi:hypothetical protein